MQAVLGILALIAAALMAVAVFMGAGPFADVRFPLSSRSLERATPAIEWVSFVFGVLAGLSAVWLARIPWAALPRALGAMLLGWRRNAVFMSLAVVSAGVLLFY